MMNYNFVPTLQHIALVNVNAILWNKQDIRTLIRDFSNSPFFSEIDLNTETETSVGNKKKIWQKIENRVRERVSQLTTVATIVKEKLLVNYVQPVGLQILNWMQYHFKNYVFDLPNQFFWTPQGIIDRRKTAEMLIKDESIDVNLRYKLACLYCCEEDILKLWNEIPEINRSFFYDIEDLSNIKQEFMAFWTRYATAELPKMDGRIIDRFNPNYYSYKRAFQFAAETGNKVAIKYFLQKLILDSETLVNTAILVAHKRHKGFRKISDPPQEYYSDVLYFLLLKMNHEEQVKVFKQRPINVMLCFLDWPLQRFYVETATHLWNFLYMTSYLCLLSPIPQKVIQGYTDYNYQKLFRELWQKTPHAHKKRLFIVINAVSDVIKRLFLCKDKENMKMFFQDASLQEKKNIIFGLDGLNITRAMVKSRDWDFLKYFIQLCISSKNDINRFKHICVQQRDPPFVNPYNEYCIEREIEFCQLLDDLASGCDKRKNIDKGDNDTAKRRCT